MKRLIVFLSMVILISSCNHNEIDNLKKKAESGDAVSQYELGGKYLKGKEVPLDIQEAGRWLKRSSDQKNARGEYLYAAYLLKYYPCVHSTLDAFMLLKDASVQEIPEAQEMLAQMYMDGSVDMKNDEKAFELFEKAANNGCAKSQYNTGYFYRNGIGVEKDLEKAFEYYLKSAKQGFVLAEHNLGLMYCFGEGDLKVDYQKAMAWYQKAANQGYADSQLNMGLMFYNGKGVEVNMERCAYWIGKAAGSGNNLAIKMWSDLNLGQYSKK